MSNSNYPTPPLVAAEGTYQFSYTTIYIKYVNPVISDGTSVEAGSAFPLRMVITSPTSRLPGHEQAYSSKSIVRIPVSGEVRLKLVPTDLYTPEGFYTVQIFEKGNKIPLETMTWKVPSINRYTTRLVTRGEANSDYIKDLNQLDIFYVSLDGEYATDGEYLTWVNTPPADIINYFIRYRRKLTLRDILVDRAG